MLKCTSCGIYVSGIRLEADKWDKIVTRQVELTSHSRCEYIWIIGNIIIGIFFIKI